MRSGVILALIPLFACTSVPQHMPVPVMEVHAHVVSDEVTAEEVVFTPMYYNVWELPEETIGYLDEDDVLPGDAQTTPPAVEMLYALGYDAPSFFRSEGSSYYTEEDTLVYAKLLSELVWYSYLPNVLVDITADALHWYWELREPCIFNRLELKCPMPKHRFQAGTLVGDPRRFLGRRTAPCGNGDVLIVSDEAMEYITWVVNQ